MYKTETINNLNKANLNLSLKAKLILSYICIAFIPILIVSSLTYIINRYILINKVSSLSNNISVQTKLNIDNYLSEIENATSLVFAHDNVLVFNPSNSALTPQEVDTQKKGIEDYLLSISLLQNFNDFALIYDDGVTIGKVSETTKNLYKTGSIYSDLELVTKNNKSKSCWLTGKDGNYNKLYYVKQINDHSIILTSIYTNELDEIFEKTDESTNSSITLLNSNNYVIYSDNKELIGSLIDDNEIINNISDSTSKIFNTSNDLVTYNTCKNEWKLINTIPKKYIFKENTTTGILTVFISLICMILSGIFGSLLSKRISSPIHDIVTKMHCAENGDLTVQTQVHGSDEISTLCNSFNNMITNIRDLINNTQSASDVVSEKSHKIKQMSEQSKEISENVSKAMEDIANGALKQTTELENTLNIMNNLANSIEQITSNLSNITNASNDTKNIGDKSLNIIRELKTKNDNSNNLMENIASNVLILANSIKEIEHVLTLINDINEQTNLLALNASIEAARAGESGKGFAVVAEEIRKLAEQSKKSTDDVSKVIKTIYSNTNTTINLIKDSKTVFEEQNQSVSFTDDSFRNIIESTRKIILEVKSMNDLINNINSQKDATLKSTNNIKIVTENSSANTQEVLAVTEEQTSNAQTLADSSDKLNNVVNSLSEILNKFKI